MERKRMGRLLAILAAALVTLGLVFGASTKAYASSGVTWDEDKTFDSETEYERIEVPVYVENDITVTIAEGKTVFVTKGIDASGHTITVTGKGMLVVTGEKGANGANGWKTGTGVGEKGNTGAPAIAGNVIVDGGATLQCTGGTGGTGGASEEDDTLGSGGDGGAGLAGNLTIKDGKAKLAGGSGGEVGPVVSDDTPGPTPGKQGVAVTGEITAPVIQVSDDDVNYEAIKATNTDAPYVMVTSEVEPEPDPDPEPAEGQDMFRLYNPYSGEHFYTASAFEHDVLVGLGWQDEGVGWVAPTEGAPVYRLYNPYGGDHHYTMSAFERDELVKLGWLDEGIGWHSAGENGIPVLRQYNPYATAGTHNYTTSAFEAESLVGLGWQDEGIGWYGL